jgi:hypothetical protein
MKKKDGLISKLIVLAAVIASIVGALFVLKDYIEDFIILLKEKFSDCDSFDDFDDDDDFDDTEIFNKKTDREYVNINITDDTEEDLDAEEESEDEESDEDISSEETESEE